MKTVGIIAEYNPFHTGHEYHIRRAKELTGADFAVIVMSPDFVQRGEPAVFDKYTRARMALRCGADLVLELPVCYATGSAEYFAEGAAALLDSLGIVDVLCFGSETDDSALFRHAARILSDEPEAYKMILRDGLKNGLTFPQARSAALSEYLSCDSMHVRCFDQTAPARFLEMPNNILGIEYCKTLYKRKSSMRILPVKRIGSDYNSSSLSGAFCSATALRREIRDNSAPGRISPYIPKSCQELFFDVSRYPVYADAFLSCLNLRLLDCDTPQKLAGILDISTALSDRIAKLRFRCMGKSYEELVSLIKTREVTEARIRRALLHLLLHIHTEDVEQFRQNGTVFYAHVLGFRRTAASLLHQIKERSMVPLIAKTAHASDLLSDCATIMWETDLYASHLYRSTQACVYHLPFKTEYEYSPLVSGAPE